MCHTPAPAPAPAPAPLLTQRRGGWGSVPTIDHSARLSTLLDDDRIVGICDALLGEGFNYASGDGNFYSGETGW